MSALLWHSVGALQTQAFLILVLVSLVPFQHQSIEIHKKKFACTIIHHSDSYTGGRKKNIYFFIGT
jgi:hypothetical protein